MLTSPDRPTAVRNRNAVDWLLSSDEPAIRYMTRRDLLGESADDDAARFFAGPKVTTLLSGQQADGGFGKQPGFASALGRLVALVELAVPPGEPRCLAAADHVLTWLLGCRHHRGRLTVIDGLPRFCASADGYVLAVCCRVGLDDPRIQYVAETLVDRQWPDGGWNCDRKATGYRSSFHESLAPTWGLYEYAEATGDSTVREAADRAAELFLSHRIFYGLRTGKPISRSWLKLHYPPYYHYDILQALHILTRMGKLNDPRTADALHELERRRQPDGRWIADWQWWYMDDDHKVTEVVDWGVRGEPNEMITLSALRILKAAKRVSM